MVNKVDRCYCCYILPCILTTSGMHKTEATNGRWFSKIYYFDGKPGYYRLVPGKIFDIKLCTATTVDVIRLCDYSSEVWI